MIDYDKLKMAHELAINSKEYYFEGVFGIHGDSDYHILDTNHDSHGFFDSEESLLEKLRELTQSEPRYKKGDTVWLYCPSDYPNEIVSVTLSVDSDEEDFYPTKAALIEAQIKYWSDMREPRPFIAQPQHPRKYADTLVAGLCAPSVGTTGCQHESNGYSYVTPNQPQMHSRKCIKCGVFYK